VKPRAEKPPARRHPKVKPYLLRTLSKRGLTGRSVLLPSDDPDVFEEHVKAYFDEYKPQGLRERELVQSLAETRWRLNRSFALEAALFSQVSNAENAEEGPSAAANVQNLIKFEKTLKNLHLQEARLNRRFDKDLAELRALQEARIQAEGSLVEENAGFEFSTDDFERYPA